MSGHRLRDILDYDLDVILVGSAMARRKCSCLHLRQERPVLLGHRSVGRAIQLAGDIAPGF